MIYLLEDDESIRKFVIYALKQTGLEACGFPLPSLFKQAVEEKKPELALLDIMLPEEDGISVLKWLRSRSETKDLPIIMLTAKSSEYDKVLGLDSGADDYLAKPFNTEELLARIRALGRRRGEIVANTNTISYGDITLNTSSLKLTAGTSEITLTLKESELLEHLMLHKEMVCSKEQIIEKLWGFDSEAESNHVEVYISFLRKKLAFVHSKVSINTIRGVGYTLSE